MTVTIALPSKGRIKEGAEAALGKAGFVVETNGNDRSYHGHVRGREDIEIAFLSASEISREVGRGAVDFGVTGEDVVRENVPEADKKVEFISRLGFGQADVVVAVPEIWLDVDTMADLNDVAAEFRSRHGRRLAIATKFWRLTQQFFTAQHGIQLYRIVESLGATEGAPMAGQADIIVDITSTGSTLKANHLKILSDGVILKSEACFVRARKPEHESDAVVGEIVSRLSSSAR